jgi:hypothetical protein
MKLSIPLTPSNPMKEEALCHCARTSRYHSQDSTYKNHSVERCWTEPAMPTQPKDTRDPIELLKILHDQIKVGNLTSSEEIAQKIREALYLVPSKITEAREEERGKLIKDIEKFVENATYVYLPDLFKFLTKNQ